jgi:mono/diheme cytochrome c family protein
MAQLERGQSMFNAYCAACHSVVGDGEGFVPQRGFTQPPSYHSERLRTASDEHLFEVISRGFGAMYPFGDRIAQADRWAIVSYVRSLQLSRNLNLTQVSPIQRARIEKELSHE